MLILNQKGTKIVNVNNTESIEISYHLGNAYAVVKAVTEHNWDDENSNYVSSIMLGEYDTSLQAEAVIQSIFAAYDSGCKTFKMPKEMPDA